MFCPSLLYRFTNAMNQSTTWSNDKTPNTIQKQLAAGAALKTAGRLTQQMIKPLQLFLPSSFTLRLIIPPLSGCFYLWQLWHYHMWTFSNCLTLSKMAPFGTISVSLISEFQFAVGQCGSGKEQSFVIVTAGVVKRLSHSSVRKCATPIWAWKCKVLWGFQCEAKCCLWLAVAFFLDGDGTVFVSVCVELWVAVTERRGVFR